MSYSAGETLVFNTVKTATGFDATNTFQSDWKCLSGGVSDHYAILHLGATGAPEWTTGEICTIPWVTTIEIWQLYVDDSTTQTNIYGHVDNILTALLAKPHMGGTTGAMRDSTVSQIGELEEMWKDGGGPIWLRVNISVLWYEDRIITIS